LLRKFKFHSNRTRITGILRVDHYTSLIISRSVLVRIRNVSGKICREHQNTRFLSSNIFRKFCCLWDNMKKNIVQTYRPQMTWRMC